jgi:hypothetical protein
MLNFGKNLNYLYREQTLIFYGNLSNSDAAELVNLSYFAVINHVFSCFRSILSHNKMGVYFLSTRVTRIIVTTKGNASDSVSFLSLFRFSTGFVLKFSIIEH